MACISLNDALYLINYLDWSVCAIFVMRHDDRTSFDVEVSFRLVSRKIFRPRSFGPRGYSDAEHIPLPAREYVEMSSISFEKSSIEWNLRLE